MQELKNNLFKNHWNKTHQCKENLKSFIYWVQNFILFSVAISILNLVIKSYCTHILFIDLFGLIELLCLILFTVYGKFFPISGTVVLDFCLLAL